MAHAERCPVCHGSGKIPAHGIESEKPCHGCMGKGWVEVRDERNAWYPYRPPWPRPEKHYLIFGASPRRG